MYTITNKFKGLLLIIAVLTSMVAFQSCSKKDECGDSCINGYCSDGDCVCSTGYTGKWCATYVGSSSGGTSSGGTSSGGTSSGGTSSGGTSSGGTSSGGTSSGGTSSGGTSSGGSTYQAMFWSNFSGSPISVYVGGTYIGDITNYYGSSTPSCGASGCVTKTYSGPTTLSYTAEDDTHNWSGTLSVTAGCNKMCLTL